MESCILFETPDKSVVLVDIPRSIEEAQALPGKSVERRLVSCSPVETPRDTPEPRIGAAAHGSPVSPSAAIAELMTLETVRTALDKVRSAYAGPWCLPRVVRGPVSRSEDKAGSRKRIQLSSEPEIGSDALLREKEQTSPPPLPPQIDDGAADDASPPSPAAPPFIPERSHYLQGSVESQRDAFLKTAPSFDLIVLDPPWPSRSVKRTRKRNNGGGGGGSGSGYTTARGMQEARELLSRIPIAARLKPDGLVAVWITNKAAVADLLARPGTGVFSRWGLEAVGEWTWLKVASAGGEPVVGVESRWRKPWERLLVARRKKGSAAAAAAAPLPPGLRNRVILAVPDVHSRKLNLRALFRDVLPGDDGGGGDYVGLEVFARNLTAGWWSWGDEVLSFQQAHHWVGSSSMREAKST